MTYFWVAIVAGSAALAGCAADMPAGTVKLDKVEAAIAEEKGKVVLVDFWATWCTPCVKKFPHVVGLQEKYGEKGLSCIAISLDDADDEKAVRDFVKDKKAKFPCFILDKPSKAEMETLEKKFGFEGGIPHLAVFDRTGKKVWDSSSEKEEKDGMAKLEKLLEQELAKQAKK